MRCGEGQARIPHLASSCSFPPADSSETAGVCERGQHRKQSETGPRKQLGHQVMPKKETGGPVPAPDSSMPCVEDAGRHVFLRNLGLRFAR